MRVSDSMSSRQTLKILRDTNNRLLSAQNRASSQQAITRPSDSPEGTAKAMRLRSHLASIVRYQGNVNDARYSLDDIDLSFDSIVNMVQQLKEMAVTAVNSARSPENLKSMSVEAAYIREDLINEANRQSDGRYIFSGDTGWERPFEVQDGTVNYLGNSVKAEIEVESGVKVPVGLVGSEVFMDSETYGEGGSLFSIVQDFVIALQNGDDTAIKTSQDALTSAEDHLESLRVEAGAINSRLSEGEGIPATLSAKTTNMKDILSRIEEVDFAEAVSELAEHETVYQAALAVASRAASRRTLVDYLK